MKTKEVDGEIINLGVIKTELKTFIKENVLERGISSSLRTNEIIKSLILEIKGLRDKPFIDIEESWYKVQKELEYFKLKKIEVQKSDSEETNSLISDLNIKISKVTEKRNKLEEKFPWLKAYRGEETDSVRPEPSENVKIPEEDLKKLIAHDRNQKVRSLEDTVADLSKMNTLLMSFVTSIYGTLSETNKGKIPEENKALIDFAVEKWPETQTRGDRQLQIEGTDLITKLFEREVQIADIIDEVKNVNGLDVKEEA